MDVYSVNQKRWAQQKHNKLSKGRQKDINRGRLQKLKIKSLLNYNSYDTDFDTRNLKKMIKNLPKHTSFNNVIDFIKYTKPNAVMQCNGSNDREISLYYRYSLDYIYHHQNPTLTYQHWRNHNKSHHYQNMNDSVFENQYQIYPNNITNFYGLSCRNVQNGIVIDIGSLIQLSTIGIIHRYENNKFDNNRKSFQIYVCNKKKLTKQELKKFEFYNEGGYNDQGEYDKSKTDSTKRESKTKKMNIGIEWKYIGSFGEKDSINNDAKRFKMKDYDILEKLYGINNNEKVICRFIKITCSGCCDIDEDNWDNHIAIYGKYEKVKIRPNINRYGYRTNWEYYHQHDCRIEIDVDYKMKFHDYDTRYTKQQNNRLNKRCKHKRDNRLNIEQGWDHYESEVEQEKFEMVDPYKNIPFLIPIKDRQMIYRLFLSGNISMDIYKDKYIYNVSWYDSDNSFHTKQNKKAVLLFDYLSKNCWNYVIGRIGVWCDTVSNWDNYIWKKFIKDQTDKFDDDEMIKQIVIKIRQFVNVYNTKYHCPSFDPYIYHKNQLIIDCYVQSCLRGNYTKRKQIELNIISLIFKYWSNNDIIYDFYTTKTCKISSDGSIISVNKKLLKFQQENDNEKFICFCVKKLPWSQSCNLEKIKIKCIEPAEQFSIGLITHQKFNHILSYLGYENKHDRIPYYDINNYQFNGNNNDNNWPFDVLDENYETLFCDYFDESQCKLRKIANCKLLYHNKSIKKDDVIEMKMERKHLNRWDDICQTVLYKNDMKIGKLMNETISKQRSGGKYYLAISFVTSFSSQGKFQILWST